MCSAGTTTTTTLIILWSLVIPTEAKQVSWASYGHMIKSRSEFMTCLFFNWIGPSIVYSKETYKQILSRLWRNNFCVKVSWENIPIAKGCQEHTHNSWPAGLWIEPCWAVWCFLYAKDLPIFVPACHACSLFFAHKSVISGWAETLKAVGGWSFFSRHKTQQNVWPFCAQYLYTTFPKGYLIKLRLIGSPPI